MRTTLLSIAAMFLAAFSINAQNNVPVPTKDGEAIPVVEVKKGGAFGLREGVKGSSYQGMDIYKGAMVSLQDKGVATVYRYDGKSAVRYSQFELASYHKYNHCNVAKFGSTFYSKDDPMPLLYVSQCQRNRIDGLKDVLYVERIAPDLQSSELVQTIVYNDLYNDFGYALQWVLDNKHGYLYGFGNTTGDRDIKGNRHRIIKFKLPSLEDSDANGMVYLRPADALENYTIEDYGYSYATIGQGLFIKGDLLIMPTGLGNEEYPAYIWAWNLRKRRMEKVYSIDKVAPGEPEDITYYKGKYVLQGQSSFYWLKF